MKPRRLFKGERPFILSLGIVCLIFLFFSLQMYLADPTPSSQGAFPLFVSSVLLLMAVFMLWEMRKCENAFNQETALIEKIKSSIQFLLPGKVPLILLYVLVYAIILPKLGFVISTLVFLLGSMFTLNREKPIRTLIVSVCVLAGIVLIFQYIFKVVLP